MRFITAILAVTILTGTGFAQWIHPTTQSVSSIADQLVRGDSNTRFALIRQTYLDGPAEVEKPLLKALAVCADDPSARVRAAVALAASNWIQVAPDQPQAEEAIEIELKLATDPSVKVRHDVVTAGLENVRKQDDRLIAGLINSVMTLPMYEGNIQSHVIGALRDVSPERLAAQLEPFWANAERDPEKASWAYLIFHGATHQQPPNVERLDDVGHFLLAAYGSPGVGQDELEHELDLRLPANTVKQRIFITSGGTLIWLVVDSVKNRQKVVDALSSSHLMSVMDDPGKWTRNIATPQAMAAIESAVRAAATQPAPATQGSYEAAFHELYDHLGSVYPNFQMKQIDWKKVGDELLPQVEQAKTQREFGLLVEELVARLQDSHAVLLPGSAQPPSPDLPQWDPGFACLMDDRDRPVVYAVEPESPAKKAGIKPGMAVVSVNGVDAKQLIAQTGQSLSKYFGYSSDRVLQYDAVRTFVRQSERGAIVHLVVEQVNGKQQGFSLTADCPDRYLPRLPVPRAGIQDSANVSWVHLDDRTGYIYVRRISQQGFEEALDHAVNDLNDVKGMIIDVRGNSGGGFEETALVNFEKSPTTAATQSSRPRFTGPIAMLIDGRCISAGEGWASWFVANKRARFFGTSTAGASSRKETYTLTNGMYQVIVPLEAYTGFLDRPIERRGLEPDVSVRCSAADLAAGKDTVVEAAKQWLESGDAK